MPARIVGFWMWFRGAGWWIAFGVLLCTWVQSLPENHKSSWLGLLLFPILLFYFLAEGLEMAFADLRDKDLDQVKPELQSTLADMKVNKEMFLESREYLVIVLIVGTTFLTHFEKLVIPWWPAPIETENKVWCLLFSLVFTTVPFVWIAQGPPKSLAISNSEAFFRVALWAWPILKLIGRLLQTLGLFIPSRGLTWLTHRIPQFRDGRNLPPSNRAFVQAALRRYGSVNYDLHFFLDIQPDGSCNLTRSSLLYVLTGSQRSEFRWRVQFDKAIRTASVDARLHAVPDTGENLDQLRQCLDAVIANQPFEKAENISGRVMVGQPTYDVSGNEVLFRVATFLKVPDELRQLQIRPHHREAVALFSECKVETDPSTFRMNFGPGDPEEFYYATLSSACQRLRMTVRLADGVTKSFSGIRAEATIQDNWVARESHRLGDALTKDLREINFDLAFPLPGTKYSLYWRLQG